MPWLILCPGACCLTGSTGLRGSGSCVSPHPNMWSFALGNEATDLLSIERGLCVFSSYGARFVLNHLSHGWCIRVHALWLRKTFIDVYEDQTYFLMAFSLMVQNTLKHWALWLTEWCIFVKCLVVDRKTQVRMGFSPGHLWNQWETKFNYYLRLPFLPPTIFIFLCEVNSK